MRKMRTAALAALILMMIAVVAGRDAGAAVAAVAPAPLKPTPAQEEASKYMAQYLLQNHFRKVPANDSLAQQVFTRYLDNLDNSKSYFLASEVEKLRRDVASRFDDEFISGKCTAGFTVYNFFLKRAREKMKYMIALLKKPQFNFDTPETLDLDHKDQQWPGDSNQLQERWRKELKYQWLSMKYSGEKDKNIAATLLKGFNSRLKLLDRQKPDDAFRAYTYALTTSFDPHTTYFSPDEFENFQIDMSRSLEGIGAKLQMENEYVVVNEIIPGGPAFKSNLLKKGDRIIAVGQGKTAEMTDVVGWRINDVVKLIRGKKGSSVRLTILPASLANKGTSRTIRLIRDRIDLEEQSAQKKIVTIGGNRIGVIVIPSFYLDFEAQKQNSKEYNSTTKDVTRILGELKREHVEGIIVDLRENGGGSLEEAVNVTGLFIPEGPVVQISNALGGKMVMRDEDKRTIYDGPLAVLVNRYSASASEIFAAAIQDYGRGIIVGERTFGKGTVQSIVKLTRPFNLFVKQPDLGQLKLTIAKFYRISGGSTQHIGVLPDIILPSMIDPETVGEDSYTSSLPWSTISRAYYTPLGRVNRDEISELKHKFQEESSRDKSYQTYLHDLATLNQIRKKKEVSLLESSFKAENERLKHIEERWGHDKAGKVKNDIILSQAEMIMNEMIEIQPASSARRSIQGPASSAN